jgi:hypothetical protein
MLVGLVCVCVSLCFSEHSCLVCVCVSRRKGVKATSASLLVCVQYSLRLSCRRCTSLVCVFWSTSLPPPHCNVRVSPFLHLLHTTTPNHTRSLTVTVTLCSSPHADFVLWQAFSTRAPGLSEDHLTPPVDSDEDSDDENGATRSGKTHLNVRKVCGTLRPCEGA